MQQAAGRSACTFALTAPTISWKPDFLPSVIGVAVGALADPKYPAPVRSIFEQSKHAWVQIDGAVEHFQQSSVAKSSN